MNKLFGGRKSWLLLGAMFFSLFLFSGQAHAAAAPVTSPTLSSITTSTLQIGWVVGVGGDETFFSVSSSLDGISWAQLAPSLPTSTTGGPISTLIPNTQNFFLVWSNGPTDSTSTLFGPAYTSSTNPTNFVASASTSVSVTLTWNANGSGTSTVYQISNGISTSTVTSTALNQTGLTTTFGSLTPSTSYTFTIYSQNHDGSLNSGQSISATTKAAQPASFVVSNVSTSSVIFTWGANNNPGSVTYGIYTKLGSDATSSPFELTSTTITAANGTFVPNSSYTFSVASKNSDGTFNTPVSVVTTTLANIPGTPVVSAVSTSSATVTWTSSTNPGTTIYTVLASDGTTVTTTAVSSSIHLSANTTYQFQVKAENLGLSGTYSNYSASSTVTTTLAATPGVLILVPVTTSSISISFDATTTNSNSAATTYAVYNASSSVFLNSLGAATTTPVWLTSSTWQGITGLVATGLNSVNTSYSFSVIARNASNVKTATSTLSSMYTLADVASAPTVLNITTSSLDFVLGPNSTNPGSVTSYVIREMNTLKYLVTDFVFPTSTLGTTNHSYLGTLSQWGTTNTLSGLDPSTQYIFKVTSENGNTFPSAGSASSTAIYTLAVAPTSVSATVNSDTAITVSWSGGAASSYNVVKGSDSAITGQSSSYQYTGLTCGTSYTFKVYGVNGDSVITTGFGTVSASTNACASAGGGGSSSIPTSVGNGASTVVVGMYANQNIGTLSTNGVNMVVYIGSNVGFTTAGDNHNLNIQNLDTGTGEIELAVSSQKQVFKLKPGETKDLDLNGDMVKDIRVTYNKLVINSADITVQTLVAGNVSNATVLDNTQMPVAVSTGLISVLPAATLNPGAALKFNYSYTNTSGKSLAIKAVRQLLDSTGKVLKTSTLNKTIKKDATYVVKVNEALSKNLKSGEYTIKVSILDVKNKNKVLAEDSTVVQIVKKYFVMSAEMPAASDISFDVASLAKVKSNVVLPTTLKAKYVYTNNTGAKHTAKMVRTLVGPDGKVLQSSNGKWTMKVGGKNSATFSQVVKDSLAPGAYTIKITAYDWTTKEVLAENMIGFAVEER